ncbi:MAG: tetratricopeptide repeat protein [Proteobacteria bacterium]|nr:tetratricopeptide repeat protein [Pseudomonadota bacterium]
MTKDNEILLKLEKAFALQQSDDLNAAMKLFEEILAQDPKQADALHGLGMAYAQQRNFPKAVEYLRQAVAQAPTIAEFHNNLGNAYQAVGNVEGALRHYHEALRLKGSYAQALNNLGTLLYRLGKYDEAEGYFQKSIRIDPHAVDTHYNLANTFIQLDKLLEAVPHYQEVLRLRSDHLGALHNLGITLCGLKRFNEAEPLLATVTIREPNNIDAWFHLGVIYSGLAQATEAIECYEKVLSLNPNHAHSHHNLATVFLHQGKKDKALEHYKIALALEPGNQTAAHMVAALSNQTLAEGAPTEYTRALFDQYAYSYDKQVKEKLKYRVPQLLREAVSPFVSKQVDTLDLGCGTGLCAPLFADIVGKMVGVDISANMIEVARVLGGYHKLIVTDIMSYLQNRNEEFDLIIAADVFVYFGSLKDVFSSCYKTLKQDGLCCFSIETLTDEECQKDPLHADFQLRITGRYAHHNHYIHTLCEQQHFEILSEKTETIRYQEDVPMIGTIYVLKKG